MPETLGEIRRNHYRTKENFQISRILSRWKIIFSTFDRCAIFETEEILYNNEAHSQPIPVCNLVKIKILSSICLASHAHDVVNLLPYVTFQSEPSRLLLSKMSAANLLPVPMPHQRSP